LKLKAPIKLAKVKAKCEKAFGMADVGDLFDARTLTEIGDADMLPPQIFFHAVSLHPIKQLVARVA